MKNPKRFILIFFLLICFHQDVCFSGDVKMPSFTLIDVDGNKVSSSDFAGQVILLNFWATWCGPCKVEIPDLVKLHQTYKDKSFQVVSIALESGSLQKIKQFAKKWKMNYPILIGDYDVARAFGGIRGIPTTFLIDSKGYVKNMYVGPRSYKLFEREIVPLLPTKKMRAKKK